MTRDDLMPLIREAGFQTGVLHDREGVPVAPLVRPIGATCFVELERFAALVAAAEREACAKVAWRTASPGATLRDDGYNQAALDIEAAIRARCAA